MSIRSWLGNKIRVGLELITEDWFPRIIRARNADDPYLERYYITNKPKMADGSNPFDMYGSPKKGVQYGNSIGVYLHRFLRSDDDLQLHSHPWRWAVAIVLAGGYTEERRVGNDVVVREVRPFAINFIRAADFHRVDLLEHDSWSLFIAGHKENTWYFWDRLTGETTPWQEFIEHKINEALIHA